MIQKFAVYVIESERGWGQKIDEILLFDTFVEADAKVKAINALNTAPTAPDIYWQAEDVKTVVVDEVTGSIVKVL